MSGLAEKLRAKKCKNEPVTIDGDSYLIIGLTRRERSQLVSKARDKRGVLDTVKLEGLALVRCAHDPEISEPIFSSPAEWDSVPAEITGPLVSAIMDRNGFDDSDLGKEPDDSPETTT